MSVRKGRSALLGALVVLAAAVFAAGAQATTTAKVTLDQGAGTQAGAFQNLGMDIKFTNSSGDTPDAMTITLPPGLLANSSINGGQCLQEVDLSDDNCQVGSGTVTAYPLDSIIPLATSVTFDLVKPPAPGDLAGLAVNMGGTQIGTTGDIKVRPSGDPSGVGLSIVLALPNDLDGIPIQIGEINSTFDSLRYPATCPSTPQNVAISVNSYNATSSTSSTTAPLSVTGCASLPYAPKAAVSAVKDSSDRVVAVTSTVTQAADESPTKNLSLSFPDATLGVNLAAIKLLCANPPAGCTPVGTATATSPLYPTALTANAYLTGTALGPQLELIFPAPFPLKLIGTVALTTKNAVFTGLPDIPLTGLRLVLNGGAEGMFLTNCNPGNGVADASSTDQNGDKTASATVAYDISGCPASSYTGRTSKNPAAPNAVPTLSAITTPSLAAFKSGHPSLSFKVSVPKKASKLKQLSVKLTPGISFVSHRVGKKTKITGVALTGAKIKSLAISHGRLVIKLRKAVTSFRVKLTTVLHESGALIADASKGKKVSLHLSLIARNTRNKNHTIRRKLSI
ncbi:MAG TPA: hypothetical protein VHU61_01545 [Solirubrobacteraceae bacterium]|jgi:hypothetical protein|nr:hypothetical protein [Solirubrobacteraceae bacterium]